MVHYFNFFTFKLRQHTFLNKQEQCTMQMPIVTFSESDKAINLTMLLVKGLSNCEQGIRRKLFLSFLCAVPGSRRN